MPRPSASLSAVSSPLRASVERASLPAVTRLSTLPRFVPFVVVLALVVGGIWISGWGWVLLAVVTLFLGWMLYLTWPHLSSPERLFRVAVLVMAVAMTVTRANPRR
jgi:fatty acid desaturase